VQVSSLSQMRSARWSCARAMVSRSAMRADSLEASIHQA
jgi:hypothetical protein